MHISHGKLAAGLFVATAVMPFMAAAQTTDVQSQIQSLLSQIQSLQLQIRTLIASSSVSAQVWMASSTPSMMSPGQMGKAACIELNRNLRLGAQGEDVKKLQEILSEDGDADFRGGATGFFGPLTAKAMMRFQSKFGIASSTDGSVGPLTRGFFERRCGEGLGKDKDRDDSDARAKIAGEITATAASTVTVRSADGISRIVNITASTTIHVFATATSTPTVGTMADLTVGKRVAAAGMPQTDGSLTAREVRVGILPPVQPIEMMKKIFKFDNRGRMMDDRGRDN